MVGITEVTVWKAREIKRKAARDRDRLEVRLLEENVKAWQAWWATVCSGQFPPEKDFKHPHEDTEKEPANQPEANFADVYCSKQSCEDDFKTDLICCCSQARGEDPKADPDILCYSQSSGEDDLPY